MANGGHRERILALLREFPSLNDDEIAARLTIEPRQTVNQICRRLAEQGLLSRQPGPGGKIVNVLSGQSVTPSENAARSSELAESPRASGISLAPDDFARTLIVIPCSGRKRSAPGSHTPHADTILHHLPADIAGELADHRASVKSKLPFDESHVVPAWQRYDGALYQFARSALGSLMGAGAHIIILSGGYGAVLANEPIGLYDTPLKPACWPGHILERVLVTYARRHELSSVRAFASENSPYRRILQRVPWRAEGVADALLLLPEAQPGGMRKSPASLGEAISAMATGNLTTAWRSSYGLGLSVQRI